MEIRLIPMARQVQEPRLEQYQECSVCHQKIDSAKASQDQAGVAISPYRGRWDLCCVCGQHVKKEDQTLAYKTRWRRWNKKHCG